MNTPLFNVYICNVLHTQDVVSAQANAVAKGLALAGSRNVMVRRVGTVEIKGMDMSVVEAHVRVDPFARQCTSIMLYCVVVDGIKVTYADAKGKTVVGFLKADADAIAKEWRKEAHDVTVVHSSVNRRYYKYAADENSIAVSVKETMMELADCAPSADDIF